MTQRRKPILCIWHDGCLDGFASAWVVTQALGTSRVELFGATYGHPVPPDEVLEGREVYLVDFSYPEDAMRHIAACAERTVVIDHHATAEDALKPLLDDGTIEGIFDMDKSGALLTWEWFFPNGTVPALIRHVSDRDLWRFHLKGTREVMATLGSHVKELGLWTELMGTSIDELIGEGRSILRDHHRKIDSFLHYGAFPMTVAGHDIMAANVPPVWASDAGHKLAQSHPFALLFWVAEDVIHVSLRSRQDGGVNVRRIAEAHGGGGHDHAAGFRLKKWSDLRLTALPEEAGAQEVLV